MSNVNPSSKASRIYISADALWDLRQGTLTTISPAFAAEVTSKPDYYTRDTDLFATDTDMLSVEIYKQVQAKHPQKILRNSFRTEIFDFIISLCREMVKRAVATPHVDNVSIEINTYPFRLSTEEASVVQLELRRTLSDFAEIQLVRLTPEEMTIKKVKADYLAMVMYEYADWLNLHGPELKATPMTEVGLYVPRLYFADKSQIGDDVRRELAKQNKDEFEFYETLVRPFITLQFLPVALFSASTPVNSPEFRQLIKVV